MTERMTLARALEKTGLDGGGDGAPSGLLVLSGGEPLRLDGRLPTLVGLPLSAEAESALLDRYHSDWEAALVTEGGLRRGPLSELLGDPGDAAYLHLPPLPWDKDLRDFRTLVEVVALVRLPCVRRSRRWLTGNRH